MARPKEAKEIRSERCQTIVVLSKSVMRQAEIASRLKLHRCTASAILKRYKGKHSYVKVETRGRKQCLNERSLRLLKSYVHQNCFESLHSITRKFKIEIDITASVSRVRRYLHRLKLKSYMTVPKPFLKVRHIKALLKWAKSYSKWNHCNWAQVAFSDGSSFVLRSSRKGTRVWR